MFQMNPEWLPLTQLAAKLQIFEVFFFAFYVHYATGRKVPGKSAAGPGVWHSQAADTSLVLKTFL